MSVVLAVAGVWVAVSVLVAVVLSRAARQLQHQPERPLADVIPIRRAS